MLFCIEILRLLIPRASLVAEFSWSWHPVAWSTASLLWAIFIPTTIPLLCHFPYFAVIRQLVVTNSVLHSNQNAALTVWAQDWILCLSARKPNKQLCDPYTCLSLSSQIEKEEQLTLMSPSRHCSLVAMNHSPAFLKKNSKRTKKISANQTSNTWSLRESWESLIKLDMLSALWCLSHSSF